MKLLKIQFNGSVFQTSASTLAELLTEQHIDIKAVAVALNGEFVPRSNYASEPLADGAKLEVLSPMQGG